MTRVLRIALAALGAIVATALVLAVLLGPMVDRERDANLATVTARATSEFIPRVTRFSDASPLIRATVVRVSDGDTIRARIGDAEEAIRFVGIDAPETSTLYDPDCYADQAHEELKRLISGKTVWLETDRSERDQYGRLLRYVWLPEGDGFVLVNELLVGRGFAVARIYGSDRKHADRLAEAERDAIRNQRGIWSACVSSENHGISGAPAGWDGKRDLDCGDFSTRVNAQAFYATLGGPRRDPHNLDVDRDGLVCHARRPTEPT